MRDFFEDKENIKRVIRISVCGLVGCLIGTGIRSCVNKKIKENSLRPISIVAEDSSIYPGVKVFNPGEHSISVPMTLGEYVSEMALPYHIGYKVAGVSIDRKEELCVMYINDETVTCSTTNVNKDGEYVYNVFGVPEDYTINDDTNSDTKVFEPGTHIVLKLVEDPTDKVQQYPYYEGYEISGICVCDYSKANSILLVQRGYVVYQNTERVVCTLEDNGYTSFGIPIKTKSLSKNN